MYIFLLDIQFHSPKLWDKDRGDSQLEYPKTDH